MVCRVDIIWDTEFNHYYIARARACSDVLTWPTISSMHQSETAIVNEQISMWVHLLIVEYSKPFEFPSWSSIYLTFLSVIESHLIHALVQ